MAWEGIMPVIVVANPKGGVGKSTLATNVAGWLARQGHAVMLGDLDRQQSARHWLALRPPQLPAIRGWEVLGNDRVRPPKGSTHLVLDTPAGLHGKRLDTVMQLADRLLIPLQPSPFDLAATHAFLQQVRGHRRADKLAVGLVAVRVKEHTHATEHLHEILGELHQAPITHLRDTQNYVHLAARGLTLWDVAAGRVERDLQQWQPLIEWLQR
jgi:chromosome partitioning protein